MKVFQFFIALIVVQLFYSFGITLISHSLTAIDPSLNENYIGDYQTISTNVDNITNKISNSLQSQMKIPVIDLGALVFYSGNIIVDLLMNFFFAVPSMITLLANGIFQFFPIDSFLATNLKLFLYSFTSIIYFINLLAFIMNIRSRGTIV